MAMPTMNDHYAQDVMKTTYAPIGAGARVETDLDAARAAFQQARELANFVHSIVNRLCGCQPEEKSDGILGNDYDPDGILPQIAQEARRSMVEMTAAMSALRRLERIAS